MAPAPTLLLVLLTLLVAPAAATEELMSKEIIRLRALVARHERTIASLHATLKEERSERALLRMLAPGRDMFAAGEGLKAFCSCKQAREGLCVLPKDGACSATAAAVDPASTIPSENPSAGPTSLQPSMLLEVSHSAARSAFRAAAPATSSSSSSDSSSASSSSSATSTSTRDMFAAGEGLKAFCSCKQAHLGLCVLGKDTPCPAVDLSHSNGGVSTVPGSNPSAGPTTLMPPTMLLETATEMATATAGRRVRRRAGRAKGKPEEREKRRRSREDEKSQKGKGGGHLFEAVEAKTPEIKGGNGVALPPSSKPASAAAVANAAAVNVAVADAAAGSGGGFGDDSPVFKKWPKESVQCRQCCDLRCMEDCLETRFR